jgi:hypothetical protein
MHECTKVLILPFDIPKRWDITAQMGSTRKCSVGSKAPTACKSGRFLKLEVLVEAEVSRQTKARYLWRRCHRTGGVERWGERRHVSMCGRQTWPSGRPDMAQARSLTGLARPSPRQARFNPSGDESDRGSGIRKKPSMKPLGPGPRHENHVLRHEKHVAQGVLPLRRSVPDELNSSFSSRLH